MSEDRRNNDFNWISNRQSQPPASRGLRLPGTARRQQQQNSSTALLANGNNALTQLRPSTSNSATTAVIIDENNEFFNNQGIVGYRLANNSSSGHQRRASMEEGRSIFANQELVRLDNPRPDILRAKNEYITVPSCSSASDPISVGRVGVERRNGRRRSSHHHQPQHPHRATFCGEQKLTDPLDFDRPKGVILKLQDTCFSQVIGHESVNRLKSLISSLELDMSLDMNNFPSGLNDGPKVHLAGRGNVQQQRLGAIRPLVRPSTENRTHTSSKRSRSLGRGAPSSLRMTSHHQSQKPPISSQPLSVQQSRSNTDFTNPPRLPTVGQKLGSASLEGSINCKNCGKCRCSACTTPKTLPSDSVEKCVDGASCMCCVRACLYHFGDAGREEGDGPPLVSDSDLCSCESPGCCTRWSCLACAMIFLPCMWCYLPLKCCAMLCEATYSRLRTTGCRCASYRLQADGFCEDSDFSGSARYDLNGNTNPVIEKQPKGRLSNNNPRPPHGPRKTLFTDATTVLPLR